MFSYDSLIRNKRLKACVIIIRIVFKYKKNELKYL